MVSLSGLWLPILASAVLIWIVSAIVWTVMPHHKSDYAKIEDEEGVMDALRSRIPGPGMYYFPWGEGSDLGTPEYKEKANRGPVGILRVRSAEATLNMVPALIKTFLLYLLVSVFVAYIASNTLPMGTDYLTVFRVTGTAAFLAHGVGIWHEHNWFGLPAPVAVKSTFDALAYALLTGGVFGWLWPI